MSRGIILGFSLLVLTMVTGCNGLVGTARPDADSRGLAAVFGTSGQYLVDSLKRLLRGAAGEDALDLQTAITLETARIPPRQVADRRHFQAEAETLDKLLSRKGAQAPTDSAVLAYLGNLANGQSASASFLSESEEKTVLELCGPTHELLAHIDSDTESSAEQLLRQSCFTWLVGDSEKSNALFYLARAGNNGLATGADNGFEAFLRRYEARTGSSLLAHRGRLQDNPSPGQTDLQRGYSGTSAPRLLSSSLEHR